MSARELQDFNRHGENINLLQTNNTEATLDYNTALTIEQQLGKAKIAKKITSNQHKVSESIMPL